MTEDTESGANAMFVYEVSEKYVGLYHHEDGEHLFQSIADTREGVVDDMVETLNHLPRALTEVRDGEAELVDAVPMKRKEVEQ